MIEFQRDSAVHNPIARIKVIGVGGAGGNTINTMFDTSVEGLEFIVANTDNQTLKLAKTTNRIQLGTKLTRGLGAGANPEIGRRSAEEDLNKIIGALDHSDIVFLTGGLGGGTGSGALPVIARAVKELGILTVAIVTKPFTFEGKRRMKIADQALEQLKKEVDTLIVIPNQKLLEAAEANISLVNAFGMINQVINTFVRSIADIILKPGHVNVDFADVRTTMKDSGLGCMGSGKASGADRAYNATQEALRCPLLDNIDLSQARGVLLNITGSAELGLHEVSQAASAIYESVHEDAHIIFGSVIDDSMGDEVMVTMVATGFEQIAQKETVFAPQQVHHEETTRTSSMKIKTNQEYSLHETDLKMDLIDENDLEVPALVRRAAQRMQNYNNI